MHFEPGTALGNYVILERIRTGGMAVVYRALHQALAREVALKVLSPEMVDQPGFIERFTNEAHTLARLDHPNILPVFDFGSVQGSVFLSMPLVRGGTLRDLMDRGPLEPGLAWRYLREVAKALQYAHENGIVHRDVKPSNVLLHMDGRGLLADFGLARQLALPSDLSRVGIAMGTPGYMAPEQALGENVDHRTDVYALGVMVFEMLTGGLPYRENTEVGVVMATLQAPVPTASERNPRLPKELDPVLVRALAKRPDDRQQAAKELLEDLRRVPFARPAEAPALVLTPPGTATPYQPQQAGPAGASRLGLTPGEARITPAGGIPAAFRDPAGYTAQTPPFGAVTSALPMPGLITAEVTRALAAAPLPPPEGSAVRVLDRLGIPRRHAQQRYAQNAFFANAVHTAREVAGERWPEVATAAAMTEFAQTDPPANLERTTPIELASKLNEAFVQTFGAGGREKLELWGRQAAESWLRGRPASEYHVQRLGLIPGHQQRLSALLRSYVGWLDELRGEPLQAWTERDEHQFWLVQYSNLFALGRRTGEKSCHFWTATLEALLRWAGLANDWLVEELECGCQTGTFDCVFAIRSVGVP